MSDNTNNTPRPSQCLWCKEGKSVGRIPPAHDCPDAPAVQQAPAPYAQRPTLEIAEAKLRDLLSSALAMGYATGSVGCSYEGTDDTFAYEVKYRITRRDAENGHGQGEAAAAGGLRGRDMGAVRAEQGRGMEGADQGTADLDDGAAVAQAAQQAPVLGAAQDDVLRLWRALERIEDEVTAERTGKIVPLAALAGISAILDEAKHGAPAAPPAPLPVDPLREAAASKRLWGASLSARRTHATGATFSVTSHCVRQPTEEEAEALALAAARDAFPQSEGWTEHVATVTEVPENWITERAGALRSALSAAPLPDKEKSRG